MYQRHGLFGIIDMDGLKEKPAWLIDIGIEERKQGEQYYFDNRRRPGYGGYLIQYTLDGCGVVEKNGIRRICHAGTGFLVRFPEDSRYYLPKGSDETWTFLYLHFAGDVLQEYIDRLETLSDGFFAVPASSRCIRMFFELHERLSDGGRIRKYESSEFIFCFLCELLRELEETAEDLEDSLGKRGAAILEREYRELSGIQEVAERLGVSVEHFCREFKQEMNISPMQYLMCLRLQSAMYELLNTKDGLEQIAKRNGFSNANYFGKVFRKRVGVTPMQYRNQE